MRDEIQESGDRAPACGPPSESIREPIREPIWESGSQSPSAGPPQDWRAWLAGGSPRAILARIIQGDPLRLRERVARKLRDGAFLFDGDRVHLRSLARCARAASNYRGRPELGAWLDGIVDAALADLLREDDECVRRGGAPHAMDGAGDGGEPAPESTPRSTRKNSGAFAELSLPLQLDPRALAFACHAFNRLPDGERRAFFELVVEGRTLDALAGEKGGATSIARRARRALCTLLSIDEHEAMPAERDATSPSPCEPRDGRGGSTS